MKTFKYLLTYGFLTTLLFFLISINFLFAEEISRQDVEKAVTNWLKHVTADARNDATIIKLETYYLDSTYYAYIAHLYPRGFCLCGADDLVLPVYFYSPEGKYDPENLNYQFILHEITMRHKYFSEGVARQNPDVIRYEDLLEKRKEEWKDLISGHDRIREWRYMETRTEPESLILDFQSLWHQGSPYNDSCPNIIPDFDPAVVGCIATAMSQTLYYWKWPYSGIGSNTTHYEVLWRNDWDEEPLSIDPGVPPKFPWVGRLEWTTENGGRLRMSGRWDHTVYLHARKIDPDNQGYIDALTALRNRLNIEDHYFTANFGNTYYDWSLIHENHTDPPDIDDNEVAQLCYHVGISVSMGYGVYGSGSGSQHIEPALENYFRYDPDVFQINSNMLAITEDLQWLRIVCIAGAGPPGGHAWIVYGYNKINDPNRQFLMNLGWGGSGDGWYTLDGCEFPNNQVTILRIAPNNVKFVGNTVLGDGSPDSPYINIEYALDDVQNNSTLIFKAETEHNFNSVNLIIDKPVTLKGYNVKIKK
jgi:hypothetical protein